MLSAATFTRSGPSRLPYDPGGESIFQRVRNEVDLHKVLPVPEQYKDFDGYRLQHCLSPEHTDDQMSCLVYHDGATCRACGWKGDTVAIYQLFHPELTPYQSAVELLNGDYHVETGITGRVKTYRTLDPDLATAAHLELARNAEAIARLEAYGLTKAAIRNFRIGLASVLVPILPKELHLVEGAEHIEWLERDSGREPYQRQWRFSVPVFADDGDLKQVIYRKMDETLLGAKVQLAAKAGTEWLFDNRYAETEKAPPPYVVLCEGWGDAIIFWQAKIPAMTGISGAGQFRAEWAEKLGRFARTYVCGDADKAGEGLNQRVAKVMPWVRPLRLPGPPGSKQDPRELWLAGWRTPEFMKLLREADQRQTFKTFGLS